MQRVAKLAAAKTNIHRLRHQRGGFAVAAEGDVLQLQVHRRGEIMVHLVERNLPAGAVA